MMPILERERVIYPDALLDEPPMDEDRNWLAIFTKSRQEKALARQLVGQRIPFYLPLVAKQNVIRGRRMDSQLPLFPGYLFVYGTADERVQTMSTNRVAGILPVTEQEQLVADLQQVSRLIATNAPLTIERRLAPGRRVRIKHGPMKGLEGTVTARRKRVRLLIAVQFLQSGVSIEIDDCMVEPMD